MTLTAEQKARLLELCEKATPGPWCKAWCYSAIRHVVRNCDVECSAHPTGEGCSAGFGRYDGHFIAAASPDVVLALLDENARLRRGLTKIVSVNEDFHNRRTLLTEEARAVASTLANYASAALSEASDER